SKLAFMFLVVWASLFTSQSFSQTLPSCNPTVKNKKSVSNFEGQVLDPQGSPIPQATITIEKKGFLFQCRVDDFGWFRFSLPTGILKITIESLGFKRF